MDGKSRSKQVYLATNNPSPSPTGGDCYVNDLALAAELGKTLLDRNRLLEQALEQARAEGRQKDIELELLHKQMSDLRDLSQKRGALVDEADGYNQELDRLNRQLLKELTVDRHKIDRLKAHVASLEQEVSDLSELLERCNCDRSCTFRPRSTTVTTGTTDCCAMRSGSPSPARYTPPPNPPFHAAPMRRPTVTTKGLFIDDEFHDQPELSTCGLSSGCMIPAELSPHKTQWSPDRMHPFHDFSPVRQIRSSSWPTLFASTSGDELHTLPSQALHPILNIQNVNLLSPAVPVKLRNVNGLSGTYSGPTRHLSSLSSAHSKEPNEFSSCEADDLKALKDVLDDATFIKHLEAIYCIKLRCQKSNDYKPRYKQLFQDAFKMLQTVKMSNPAPSHNHSIRRCI